MLCHLACVSVCCMHSSLVPTFTCRWVSLSHLFSLFFACFCVQSYSHYTILVETHDIMLSRGLIVYHMHAASYFACCISVCLFVCMSVLSSPLTMFLYDSIILFLGFSIFSTSLSPLFIVLTVSALPLYCPARLLRRVM